MQLLRNGDYPDRDLVCHPQFVQSTTQTLNYDCHSQAALNVDAINHWRDPIFQSTYHESGIIVVGEEGTKAVEDVQTRYENVSLTACAMVSRDWRY